MTKHYFELLEMAFSRNEFKNKIEEYLTGAFYEYVIASFIEHNDETKWVEHKKKEVEGLLIKFDACQFLSSKGRWNKEKAANEVIDQIISKKSKYFTSAENTFERYFKKKPNKKFLLKEKENLTKEFFSSIQSIMGDWK